jgi:hypothetical protein
MEKKFVVYRESDLKGFKTYEEAEVAAKRNVAANRCDYFIWQPIAVAKSPVPEVEVTKL